MKRLKLMGVMLVAVCAMGLMASSAFALPDVSITLGAAYPLQLKLEEATVKTKLETTAGTELQGEGLNVLTSLSALGALGTFRATFLKVERGGVKCFNTGTEANGEVLTEGSFHIVYTSLAGSAPHLQLGILYLPKELSSTNGNEIGCPGNGVKIKVRGSVIGAINLGTTTEVSQLTGLKSVLGGSLGKQNYRAYWTDEGAGLLAKLESNVSGTGFKESNQVVAGEPEATAVGGKMFVITSR